MFLKMLSTRRTQLGMLRHGVIYNVDADDPRSAPTVAALLDQDNPAAVALSEEEVEAERAAVESVVLSPEAESTGGREDSDELVADLERRLADEMARADGSEAERTRLSDELDALRVRAETAEAALAEVAEQGKSAEGKAKPK